MPVSYLQMGGIYRNRQSPVTIYLETLKFNQDLVPCTSPKKVCFEALIVVFHFLFEQKPAPAPSFLLNNNKDKQFKKGTELLSSKLSHSCQSLSIDRYAKGCVTSFLSSVFKFHLTLLHPVAERAKIASSAL